MRLEWQRYDFKNMDDALRQSYCLYVFHHPDDGDRPYYIGKAKYFGTQQEHGYASGSRYNSGYVHLIAGMLRSGFSLYIAPIGETEFEHFKSYEQELIMLWNPVREQKREKYDKRPFDSDRPWVPAERPPQ